MKSWTTFRWSLALLAIAAASFWLGRFSNSTPLSSAPSVAAPSVPSPVTSPTLTKAGDWPQFALLLVDIQNEFFTPELQAEHKNYSKNVTELLDDCRDKGIEVIHLRTEFSSFDELPASYKVIFQDRLPCLRGSQGVLPASFATELPGERVFYKATFDGFSVAGLTTHLSQSGKRHLLIAGLTTDLCVFATALGALDKGYSVSIVDDCCLAYSAPAHAFIVNRYGGFLFDTVPHDRVQQSQQRWLDQLEFFDRGNR